MGALAKAVPLLDHVLACSETERAEVLDGLGAEGRRTLFKAASRELGTPFAIWVDDPVGFCQYVLGLSMWSRQRTIARSLVAEQRTVVPSAHATGKTVNAAALTLWFGAVHPVGTAQVVTTADLWRRVHRQLWPNIRRLHEHGRLPGLTDMTQWKIGTEIVAYGFAAAQHNEDAFSGIHAPKVLVIIDESGGVSHAVGRGVASVLSSEGSRVLAIGNPPVDTEGSWFEEIAGSDLWRTIEVPVDVTPNFTGERTAPCGMCPPQIAEHPLASHLVTPSWASEITDDFGEGSNYVIARRDAQFPHGATNTTIPVAWVEDCIENDEPAQGKWVRLGVDVAADGGDELAIARADGYRVRIVHTSSGAENANAVDVAGKVLQHIREAQEAAEALGSDRPVRVKVDAIGVGWGVASLLVRWGEEGKHRAEVIAVHVGERALDADQFANQKAEAWWTLRKLCQPRRLPDGTSAPPWVAFPGLDRRTIAQLSAPRYSATSGGQIKIERKVELKRRGMPSPDRAEAVVLAFYEPEGFGGRVRTGSGQRVPTGAGAALPKASNVLRVLPPRRD